MVAPSGEQHVIEAAGYRAVVTECGAGLRVLEYDGRALVLGYPEDQQASGGKGQLLLPWPNRIADGRYTFEGRELQLPLTEVARGHASHGLTRWASWTPVEQTRGTVTLGYRLMSQPGYPWTVDLRASYSLSDDGLAVEVNATNQADRPAPFAAGAHPYLVAGSDGPDAWVLELPASTALETDDRLIPYSRVDVEATDLDFRAARPIGTTHLDHAFTDLARDEDGRASVRLAGVDGGVTLWMDRHHRWVQAFTGPPGVREALAVEPMTAPPNAFATGEDLLVLAPAGHPGDSVTVAWGLRAG